MATPSGRLIAKGITIAEVVVASAIMLAAILPILHALTRAQATARLIEWKTHSLVLAQGRLEQIKASAAADYDQSFSQSGLVLDEGYVCTVVDTYGPGADIRTITVSVGYDRDADGSLDPDEPLVTLTGQIARR
ncbi:MAG: hypothetical protein QHH07_02010 [Sedimentisphaerales bacterium]|nr:hypothetical protein [Sedimentisphaerales bacterium]